MNENSEKRCDVRRKKKKKKARGRKVLRRKIEIDVEEKKIKKKMQ